MMPVSLKNAPRDEKTCGDISLQNTKSLAGGQSAAALQGEGSPKGSFFTNTGITRFSADIHRFRA
jgi:hypothetical protein